MKKQTICLNYNDYFCNKNEILDQLIGEGFSNEFEVRIELGIKSFNDVVDTNKAIVIITGVKK